jgi:methionyl-tRNA formyltransferase
MPHDKLRLIFLGTPEFAVPALRALIDNNFKPFLVVTQPDKPVGRRQTLTPPPVKILAQKFCIPVEQPKDKDELKKIFNDCQVDICVLTAFGMIIADEILVQPKLGFLNIHPSLLPKYRGTSPIQQAILDGEQKTGVSIIKLVKEVDAGPIIGQAEVEIVRNDNAITLSEKLAQAGADLLLKSLPDYLAGKIEPVDQNNQLASLTKMIERHDGRIDWQKSAVQIDRQFRAFYPWPGTFTYLAGKRLKIVNLSVLEGDLGGNLKISQVFLAQNGELSVRCGQGAISLLSLQLEGKREMTASEFLRGHKYLPGKVLE